MGRTWPDLDNEPPRVQLKGNPVPGHHCKLGNTVVCIMSKEQLRSGGREQGRAGVFCKNALFEEPGWLRLVCGTHES